MAVWGVNLDQKLTIKKLHLYNKRMNTYHFYTRLEQIRGGNSQHGEA